jgi:trigger factor
MTEESFTTQQKSYAEDRASQELALNAIIKAEKIELTDDEYKAGVAKILTDYGYASEDELFKSATEAQIKESLIWEKAVNFVTEQAVEL